MSEELSSLPSIPDDPVTTELVKRFLRWLFDAKPAAGASVHAPPSPSHDARKICGDWVGTAVDLLIDGCDAEGRPWVGTTPKNRWRYRIDSMHIEISHDGRGVVGEANTRAFAATTGEPQEPFTSEFSGSFFGGAVAHLLLNFRERPGSARIDYGSLLLKAPPGRRELLGIILTIGSADQNLALTGVRLQRPRS